MAKFWTGWFLICLCLSAAKAFVISKKQTFTQKFSSSACCLFFRPLDKSKSKKWKLPLDASEAALSSLPCQIDLLPTDPTQSTTTCLKIRKATFRDISSIADMCVEEYGTSPEDNPLVASWLDRMSLRLLVDYTSRLKLLISIKDHAIIVAEVMDNNNTIVGMIEVSLQPILPQRNPPPYPVPFKNVLYKENDLQGWITNLLIIPEYRGMGLSKLLVRSTEEYAVSHWQCRSMHLHCDADRVDGKIPQNLYNSMGYINSGRVVIDQVPLFYLSKNLV